MNEARKAPQGPQGPQGERGVVGVAGAEGAQGEQGSPDTPLQVRDKLVQVDGEGSTVDADTVDGISSGAFLRSDSADQAQGEIRFLNSIRPSAGGGAGNGIRWLDNAHGGGGDAAWIQWVSEDGENTALRIGVANDDDDNLEFYSPTAIRLTGPVGKSLGFSWQDTHGGDGDFAYLGWISDGAGDNTALRIHVGNDADDNLELRASGGVDIIGGLRVNGATVPLDDAAFLDRIRSVDGAGSGIVADQLDGLDSNQFLRSDRDITLGGSMTAGGFVQMNSQQLRFQAEAGDSAAIFEERLGADSTRLVIEKTDNPADQIAFRWRMCCDAGTQDVMVLNRTDVSINDANLVINDRFTLPSRGYYFQIRRPNADVETGIQFRTWIREMVRLE